MKENGKLNIGIIGLGWPGQRHSEGVAAVSDAHLYAAADADTTRREDFAKHYPKVKLFAVYEEMLRDPAVDAVVICLPNFLHFPATMAALRAGKHVLCEKPPTLNRQEMRKIRDEAGTRGLVYAFGRQMRFNGRMALAREVVASGRLGEDLLWED